MEVDFAILAEGAEAANGKVHMVGGAFDTIWARGVPLRYPKIAFVFKLLASAAELDRALAVEIKIMNEDGKTIPPAVGGKLEIKRNPNLPKGWKQGFLSVMNFTDLTFPAFGDYSFELVVNNTGMKSIPLRIAQAVDLQT